MLELRKAQLDDAKFVYNLRFSQDVVETSFSSRIPSMEEHLKWWNNMLEKPDHSLLIAYFNDSRVGYLRYDITGDVAEISIALEKSHRGRGLGKLLLQEGENWILKNTQVNQINAKVLISNKASLEMFKSQHFQGKFIHLEKAIR